VSILRVVTVPHLVEIAEGVNTAEGFISPTFTLNEPVAHNVRSHPFKLPRVVDGAFRNVEVKDPTYGQVSCMRHYFVVLVLGRPTTDTSTAARSYRSVIPEGLKHLSNAEATLVAWAVVRCARLIVIWIGVVLRGSPK
jgi:hypothetical protein